MLKGFWGIRDGLAGDSIELDFAQLAGDAELVAIVGNNGRGKTTIMVDNMTASQPFDGWAGVRRQEAAFEDQCENNSSSKLEELKMNRPNVDRSKSLTCLVPAYPA
jgi:predicted ATP-binding protein involved in virulence